MANSGNRQLHILKYLYLMTDEDHYLTAHRIVEYLETVGIHTHRQTVCADIEELVRFGFDIVCVKSSQNRYYIKDRKFSMSELTLLVDAVSASRTITQEQSDVLVKKLSGLTSSYNITAHNIAKLRYYVLFYFHAVICKRGQLDPVTADRQPLVKKLSDGHFRLCDRSTSHDRSYQLALRFLPGTSVKRP